MVTVRDLAGPEAREWYGRRAAGGAGLVIVEATAVPRFGDDLTGATLRPLVDVIHRHGALAAIQLFPTRIGANPEVDALTTDELAEMVTGYALATRICLEAGFDGVEPHGAHGYLLNRFFSVAHNQRTDAYGGALGNRARLAEEIVRAVVAAAAGRLLILYRHTPVMAPGYGVSDSLVLARRLVAAGVDILDLSPSSQAAPGDLAAAFMGLGAAVVTVGCMDEPGRADEALGQARADLVAVGRGLIADPDWPRKAQAGQWAQIVRCTKCNEKCFGHLRKRLPIACTQWV